MANPTVNVQVQRCIGLIDTKDLTEWEEGFVSSIAEKTNDGEDCLKLSEKQRDALLRIFKKHFAG